MNLFLLLMLTLFTSSFHLSAQDSGRDSEVVYISQGCSAGPEGAAGTPGANGAKGIAGSQGPQGPQGAAGEPTSGTFTSCELFIVQGRIQLPPGGAASGSGLGYTYSGATSTQVNILFSNGISGGFWEVNATAEGTVGESIVATISDASAPAVTISLSNPALYVDFIATTCLTAFLENDGTNRNCKECLLARGY